MKTLSIALSLFCLLASPITAQAQDSGSGDSFEPERLETAPPRQRPTSTVLVTIPAGLLYASFDSDADYVITKSELEAGARQSFKAADSNQNGTVSLVELAAWREKVLGSLDVLPGNTQFDKNFDSSIAREEFESVLFDIYTNADRNEDGVLDFSELTRPHVQRGQRGDNQQRGSRNRDRGGQGGQRGGQRGQRRPRQ